MSSYTNSVAVAVTVDSVRGIAASLPRPIRRFLQPSTRISANRGLSSPAQWVVFLSVGRSAADQMEK